jgi:hypothetical protein
MVELLLIGLVVVYAFIFARWPTAAFASVLLVGTLQILNYNLIQLSIGSLHVYPADAIVVVLAAATVLRIAAQRRVYWVLSILVTLYLINFARGAALHGLQGSSGGTEYGPTNEIREFLYLFVTAAYFSSIRDVRAVVRLLRRWWPVVAACLGVMGLVFLARYGFGTYASASSGGARPLNSQQALFVLEATVLMLAMHRDTPRFVRLPSWVGPLLALGIIFISFQRTVWVATIVVLLSLSVWRRRGRERNSGISSNARLMAVLAGLLVVIAIVAGPADLVASTSQATTSATSAQGTLSWRTDGWSQLIKQQNLRPMYDQLLGNPSGTGYRRVVQHVLLVVIPHSDYVSILLTGGIFGLALFLWMLARTLARLRRLARISSPNDDVCVALFVLLLVQLVFSITYSLGPLEGMILGLALAWIRNRRPLVVSPVVDLEGHALS